MLKWWSVVVVRASALTGPFLFFFMSFTSCLFRMVLVLLITVYLRPHLMPCVLRFTCLNCDDYFECLAQASYQDLMIPK